MEYEATEQIALINEEYKSLLVESDQEGEQEMEVDSNESALRNEEQEKIPEHVDMAAGETKVCDDNDEMMEEKPEDTKIIEEKKILEGNEQSIAEDQDEISNMEEIEQPKQDKVTENDAGKAIYAAESVHESRTEDEANGTLEPGLYVYDEPKESAEDHNQHMISEPEGSPTRRTRRNLMSTREKEKIYKIPQGYHEDPNFPDQMLAGILQSFIKNGKTPEMIYQAPLVRYTNHLIEVSAREQNYDDAKTYESALSALMNLTDSNELAAKQEAQKKQVLEKLQSVKEAQSGACARWNDRIEMQKKKNEEAMKTLLLSHKSDEQEFELKWASPEFLAPFNKPSPTLLRLKQIEENLALTKNFERAKDMKKQIEALQKEEAAESRRRAIEAMRKEYRTMETRHKREIECHEQYCESVVKRLELEKEREIRGYELVIKRYEESTAPKPRAIKEPVVYSSRPIKRYSYSTTSKILPTLNIGGINVKKYLRTKKPESSRRSTGLPVK